MQLRRVRRIKRQLVICTLGGPIASYVFALLAFLLGEIYLPTDTVGWTTFLEFSGFLSLLVALFSTFPYHTRMGGNDAYLLRRLVSSRNGSTQMIAAHAATMECYRRAMLPQQTVQGQSEALNQANKLSRTYGALVEALNRHRGKGQQKVTVEHVHVYAGGQAVVGLVEPPLGRGRENTKDQPHAKQLTYEPQQALRSADEEREGLPVGGDAERALPDARWSVARTTKR